ncbi:hypothetical protein [Bradyrhizobium sp. CCBAU 11357]|uniref:hypothetical protein n=1 Tax=Bradyrhizobium sp. CCBAU 11357 TaxID=1630808 RepID=UPI002302410A|nr:hypothetical protein [Bradyrhizobium sp. CCBAU 11357]MDA9496706.1 hypothetical protein [Bradyrhizobium sp. CCBAU 11357]
MRFILALSFLITFVGVAEAAQVRHAHRRHAIIQSNQGMISSGSASGFAYAPPPSAPHGATEPYFGASQGYAPGEKERFLHSVFSP